MPSSLFAKQAKWGAFLSEVLNLSAPSFVAIFLQLAQRLDDSAANKTLTEEEQTLRTSLIECAKQSPLLMDMLYSTWTLRQLKVLQSALYPAVEHILKLASQETSTPQSPS